MTNGSTYSAKRTKYRDYDSSAVAVVADGKLN
jgi:glucosamine 6-phosphate synthetase-like amidotransferase/phosphosugar isomerase protein